MEHSSYLGDLFMAIGTEAHGRKEEKLDGLGTELHGDGLLEGRRECLFWSVRKLVFSSKL